MGGKTIDVGRNSQPARWAADSTFPTVATGLQSVKRERMQPYHNPAVGTLLASFHDEVLI